MRYVETKEICLDEIEVNPNHVREETLQKGLDGLARSIQDVGLIHPVVVRILSDGQRPYGLIAGERRFLAHQKLGLAAIRADLWEATEEEVAEAEKFEKRSWVMTLTSNVQAEPLSSLELGKGFKHLQENFGLSSGVIAEACGYPLEAVEQAIRTMKIAPGARKVIEENREKVTESHVHMLAETVDATPFSDEVQVELVRRIIDQEDKLLAQQAGMIPDELKKIKRELAKQRRAAEPQAAVQRRRHSDTYKAKYLFEKLLVEAEQTLEQFKKAELPSLPYLADQKRMEDRCRALSTGWTKAAEEKRTALQRLWKDMEKLGDRQVA